MIPVVSQVARTLDADPIPLIFGMVLGASLGGNITPFGASANVVAVGLLRKEGYTVSTGDFVRIGLPFTLAATSAGALFLWLVWR
jgi:Na+/H+ antiporter NhaD/arsenite permease-like protein